MKLMVLFLAFVGISHAKADMTKDLVVRQVILLDSIEAIELRHLISTDPQARLAFEPILGEAKNALKDYPKPLEVIYYEGLVDDNPLRTKTKAQLLDVNKAYDMAYAYLVTGDKIYAQKVISYSLAWAETYIPTGNPINENKLTPLIGAYEMVKKLATKNQAEKIEGWLSEIATKNIEKGPVDEKGNWLSKRLKIAAMVGLITENPLFKTYARNGLQAYIDNNFYSDGTSYDLRHRDALSYHSGGVAPVLTIMLLLRKNYPDLYAKENKIGGSVKKAVEFMLPYAKGEKVYKQWTNSKVEFDRARYKAGDNKYKPGTVWDPSSGLTTYLYAQFFDHRFIAIIAKTSNSTNEKYPSWETVLTKVIDS